MHRAEPSTPPMSARLARVWLAVMLALAMLLTAVSAQVLRPVRYLADTRPAISIDASIPTRFGDWRMLASAGGIVNPQQSDLLNALYAEIVTRTYVNARGQHVMLSIAYGKRQNDSFQVHRPEICYPAQGFELQQVEAGELRTVLGVIPVRRLQTRLGPDRPEPVTYWTTLGDDSVHNGIDKKLKEIRLAMKGYIADGLLFRLSSIDADAPQAWALQARFAEDLLSAVDPATRQRLAGLAQASTTQLPR